MGDLATSTLTANYLATTMRRTNDLSSARTYITMGLTGAAAIGDLYVIQALLFNCGHILLDLRESNGCEALGLLAIEALERVSIITENHNIGADSAQNELLIANYYMARDQLGDAKRMIEKAQAIVDRSGNAYDLACFQHTRTKWQFAAADQEAAPSGARDVEIEEVVRLCTVANRSDLAAQARSELSSSLIARRRNRT